MQNTITRPHCGTATGYTQHRQKFAEPACGECLSAWRDNARRLRSPGRKIDRSCASCGRQRPPGSHRYCSAECRPRYQQVDRKYFTCVLPACHNICITAYADQKFCSDACAQVYKKKLSRGLPTLQHPHWVMSRQVLGPTLNDWPMFGPTKAPNFGLCGCGTPITANRKRCVECARVHNIDRIKSLYWVAAKSGQVRKAMKWRYELVEYLRERDGDKCALCCKRMRFDVTTGPNGKSDQGATIDHVLPRSLDGSDELSNLQLAHWACNRAKSNRGSAEQLRLVG